MPQGIPPTLRSGQAMAELVIALLALVTLVIGVSTLGKLALSQLSLRKDLRLEAGTKALNRSTDGWVEAEVYAETRRAPEHRINARAELHRFSPALTSRLPASNYTLYARDFTENELGLRETKLTETVPLDDAFIRLIYPKSSVRLSETLTFPALDGLWTDAADR